MERGRDCERRLKTLALGRLKRLAPDVVLLLRSSEELVGEWGVCGGVLL